MKDLTIDNITDVVIGSLADTRDARLKDVLEIFIRKIHEAAREANLSHPEWEYLVNFLKRTGAVCDDQRNEFILLSDLTGLSSLVDMLGTAAAPDASERSVLGPFYVPDAPLLPVGGDLVKDNDGARIVAAGRVLATDGAPIGGALLEFWQNAANGLYSNVDPDQDDDNLRCRMIADADGSYGLSTVLPVPYEVPDDGTGGDYMRATGRHCWRPSHLHVRVRADGYEDLVTEIFNRADPYIEEDATFGVRDSLAVAFDREPTADERTRFAYLGDDFHMMDFDFVLKPAA